MYVYLNAAIPCVIYIFGASTPVPAGLEDLARTNKQAGWSKQPRVLVHPEPYLFSFCARDALPSRASFGPDAWLLFAFCLPWQFKFLAPGGRPCNIALWNFCCPDCGTRTWSISNRSETILFISFLLEAGPFLISEQSTRPRLKIEEHRHSAQSLRINGGEVWHREIESLGDDWFALLVVVCWFRITT